MEGFHSASGLASVDNSSMMQEKYDGVDVVDQTQNEEVMRYDSTIVPLALRGRGCGRGGRGRGRGSNGVGSRGLRGCNWIEYESLILIEQKQLEHEKRHQIHAPSAEKIVYGEGGLEAYYRSMQCESQILIEGS